MFKQGIVVLVKVKYRLNIYDRNYWVIKVAGKLMEDFYHNLIISKIRVYSYNNKILILNLLQDLYINQETTQLL